MDSEKSSGAKLTTADEMFIRVSLSDPPHRKPAFRTNKHRAAGASHTDVLLQELTVMFQTSRGVNLKGTFRYIIPLLLNVPKKK